MRCILFVFLLAAVCNAQLVPDFYPVQAVIGTGARGDGGPAVSALLDGPAGLAEDSDGNVYISESNAGVIRRVGPGGVIERFAGTGKIAKGADQQPAIETDLLHPTVLAVASDGGLLFAEPDACRIRKVLTDGTLLDYVGTGICAGSTGGFPGGGGSSGATAVRRPLEAEIGTVGGMVVDSSGRLVFSDETNHVVRRLDSDGYVRTIAGVGTAGFYEDEDYADNAADESYLHSPRGLAFDDAGNLYVADSGNCRVRRIDSDGIISTVGGSGTCATASTTFTANTATRVALGTLAGLAYDRETNSVLIAAPGQARLLRLELTAKRISSALGDGRRRAVDTTSPQDYSLDQPKAVLVSSRAGILVADSSSFAVVQLQDGKAASFAGFWPQLAAYPSAVVAPLLRPHGLCIGSNGSMLLVDAGAERILSFRRPDQLAAVAGVRSPIGYSSGDNGPALQAQLADPDRVACAPNGDVYLTQGNQIRVVNQEGIISTVLTIVRTDSGASMLSDPTGLVIDSAGRLLFSEAGAHRVIRYDLATHATTVIAGTGTAGFDGDGGAATEAELDSPGDLALDSTGNLLIADRGNNRIRRVSPDGTIQTIAGSSGTFSYVDISGELATDVGLGPIEGLAVDSEDRIYLSEYARVSVVDTEGRIHVVTGFVAEDDHGVKSYIDGPLNGCDGLAVDSEGRLYFSVREDGRVMVAVPKSLNQEGVVSATNFGGFPSVAPGTWMQIFGSGLAEASREWASSDFDGLKAPTSLDGVGVSIGGQNAFVAYISPSQVLAQVPSSTGLGQQQVTVTNGASTAAIYTVNVNATQPGLFAPLSFKVGARQYAAASISGGSTYAAPSGAIPGANSRPALPGEVIVLYGIGFGQVTPHIDAGEVVQQLNTLDLPIQFSFGGTPAAHVYAGLVTTCMGLYQFNVIVPSGVAGDAVPLSFTLGGASGEQTLFVAIGVQ
jgi:uncharacterized protein (TIGR03437 family)